ncbi:MAG: MFS transporter [Gemmatimonadaceae bacterium]|nr:MFS transporter [Gemmatimonadaceae bacterium]NUQ93911.1 MFS transporter [Gemmatimonadaceae bacterium]NUR21148.1 MFS transporter [Gemmatimonadaceae bacterium]NUS97995.1 MFS transporter [Gemmatimonadaceae bacterium]
MSGAARPRLTRALSSRNFRLFFSGQSVSLIGTWITRIATSWLVYRLTHSALLLGIVGFCGQIPTLVLAPMAGVLVDRWDRHRLLVWTQVLSALQSLALALLALSGTITVGWILGLQVVQGVINAFDTPARQAFVIQMVEDRADLPNAIALNSTMVNGSRIIGPSIGGVIIAAAGEGWCFMLDAISYIAVIVSLLAMRIEKTERRQARGAIGAEMRAGFEYVSRFMPVRTALLLLALVSTMGMPYTVLMPMVAAQTLHGGPHTLGSLMTASGLGAVAGALYLASRRSVLGLGRAMALATLAFGAGLVAFSFARTTWVALLVLPIVGAGMMIEMASTNTVLQTIVEEELRGRVMAFYSMAFLGTAPIGSLIAGVVADRIGAAETILLGGIACVAGAGWLALRLPRLREQVRPIYIERGIISAVQGDAAGP